jgi:NADP-dependent 3-hydroxy acid dehydrogenase YdfG
MSSVPQNATVLLIGASRGLGYAIAEEYIDRGSQVVATVRGPGRTALHELQEAARGRLEIEHVDINAPEQIQTLRDRLISRTFDLLFVNAGVTNGPEETTADVTNEEFTRLMVTNALSPMRVIEALGELVAPNGTIAIMSSGQGSIANNHRGGFEIYRASKSALNPAPDGTRLGQNRARRTRRPPDHQGEHPQSCRNGRGSARASRTSVPRLPRPDCRLVRCPNRTRHECGPFPGDTRPDSYAATTI